MPLAQDQYRFCSELLSKSPAVEGERPTTQQMGVASLAGMELIVGRLEERTKGHLDFAKVSRGQSPIECSSFHRLEGARLFAVGSGEGEFASLSNGPEILGPCTAPSCHQSSGEHLPLVAIHSGLRPISAELRREPVLLPRCRQHLVFEPRYFRFLSSCLLSIYALIAIQFVS
jgi:hypothetical protein